MSLLEDIKDSFVSGNVMIGGICQTATPAYEYTLFCVETDGCNATCDGVILDANGYDSFRLQAALCNISYWYYWTHIYVQESADMIGWTTIYSNSTQDCWANVDVVIPLSKRYIKIVGAAGANGYVYMWSTPPCVPNWQCRQPLDGYEHDVNNCGEPDRLNVACNIPCIIKRDEGIYSKPKYCYIGEGISTKK